MGDPKETVVTVVSKMSEHGVTYDACLVVIYGAELGKKYNVDKKTVVIGRSPKSDIQVDQESVSRSHAKISLGKKGISVKDMGSTNGTYVNDKTIDEVELSDGDLVKIGRTIFKFLSGDNIENAYHEEIYRLTTIDGLTETYNRRYFTEALEREISRSHRYGRELSLILFDIDHFKKVNDSLGHLAGDHVLRKMAELVKGNIRREDVLARYGGEEFAVILPEIDLSNAKIMADKLRKLIEIHDFSYEGTKIPTTVSVGVATSDDTLSDAPGLIKSADEMLLKAKEGGRNRIES